MIVYNIYINTYICYIYIIYTYSSPYLRNIDRRGSAPSKPAAASALLPLFHGPTREAAAEAAAAVLASRPSAADLAAPKKRLGPWYTRLSGTQELREVLDRLEDEVRLVLHE